MRILREFLVGSAYAAISRGLRPTPWQLEAVVKLVARTRLRRAIATRGVNLVVDVGAHDGSFVRLLRGIGYDGRIASLEPSPDVYARLASACAGDRNWLGVNVALGRATGTRAFHAARNSAYNSFLHPRTVGVERTYEVAVTRLDELFPRLAEGIAAPRVFLKIDTQGFDLEVIAGATRCLDRVVLLQSEVSIVPLYDGMPHYLEALHVYERQGFTLLDMIEVLRDRRSDGVVEFDCLMARPERPARDRS
jgi:FkbM family methyltransferase